MFIYIYVCVLLPKIAKSVSVVCCLVQHSQYIFNFFLKMFVMLSQQYLFNCPLITFSFLYGGIYNFTPTPQRSERGRRRGRERESGLKDWNLTTSLGYFDVTLTWCLWMYLFLIL